MKRGKHTKFINGESSQHYLKHMLDLKFYIPFNPFCDNGL